ncbi:tRNA1(Val) (adenine(37)-N6)-methyltransferase [Candidatus Symbiopectobacterium sp. NZEC151]|uniref:tRNA(1)(Val) (adenine(37)-N(6))-methyltransferase TrmN n=2 Tax=unclassified Symbiopectobacterium TaxID=2794573 RepID=UPI002226E275|nr:tRNA1(Val) (adenine(37)-N6)-methyltransferase [Candidatus Symbiopectobacterium sp. NZEC151]MCW2477374.1 tRNA1(Val) (adenine(37)-N6)-methyltransferase [Candidatus Symbiopectobacterium sp. NZEC151]
MHQHAARAQTLRRNGFTFKQFFVAHDRCAMKVGTDAILLGAWAPVPQTGCVLDIGSGSGVITLMLAQRSPDAVTIDAVELEPEASAQAQENRQASPWASRITVVNRDIETFTAQTASGYALIVSNPPYFAPGSACRSEARSKARYTESLSHETLLQCAARLLEPEGRFCVVLPSQVASDFCITACQQGWSIRQRLAVREREEGKPHRELLTLSKQTGPCERQTLTVRAADGSYSCDFRALTQDFYLFM